MDKWSEEDDEFYEEEEGYEEEEEEDELSEEGEWADDFRVSPSGSAKTCAPKGRKRSRKKPAGAAVAPGQPADVMTEVARWRAASREERFIDPHACQPVLRLVLDHLKRRYAAHFVASSTSSSSSSSSSRPSPSSSSSSSSSSSTSSASMKRQSHVTVDKVELVFSQRGREIQCQPGSGRIEFGMHTIKQEFYDGATSKYALENEFMSKVCRTKEDVLMWFMLHEFCHLFKGGERHGHAFFTHVLSLARENGFLFGQSSP